MTTADLLKLCNEAIATAKGTRPRITLTIQGHPKGTWVKVFGPIEGKVMAKVYQEATPNAEGLYPLPYPVSVVRVWVDEVLKQVKSDQDQAERERAAEGLL